MRAGIAIAASAAAMLALAGAGATAATAPTRAEYVEQAEEICSSSKERTLPTLKGLGTDLKKDRFKVAGRKLTKGATLLERLYGRLLDVPKPTKDAALLDTWLKRLKTQNDLMAKAGELLLREKGSKAQGYLARYAHAGNLANDTVLGFGFHSCLFRFAKLPKI